MRRIIGLAGAWLASLCAGSLAAAPARPIASYQLSARLNAETHVISAKGKIRWTNPSTVPAERLYFHLYLNAFKNDDTLFLRSPFLAGRSGEKATTHGHIDVERLSSKQLPGGDLWPLPDAHTPGDPKDQTDIEVPLPRPIAPNETVTFDIEFEATLPKILERTGYVDDYHFVAQWFPKLAKREPDGTWAHFPFHPHGEFYADFGDYRVTLDVPEHMEVGATGQLRDRRTLDGRKQLTFTQKSVHDFAWVAWPAFSKATETIDGIATTLLYPAGSERQRDRALDALAAALPRFNRLYGRYPYPTLTVVHPPDKARASGGMEYPTLITTGSRSYTALLGLREVEVVTVHELAHQWFYGLVATNEHRWPFLDEGLTSYAEGEALEALYGHGSLLSKGPIRLAHASFTRAFSAARGRDQVVAQPASAYLSFGSLGALVYNRTATAFDTLARVYGRRHIARSLGAYARRYRFSHPEPEDLLSVLGEQLPREAVRNLEAILFDRASIDLAVLAAESIERPDAPGAFDNRALFVRRGTLSFPVDIELLFADGGRERRRWDGRGAVHAERASGSRRLTGAVIDPDYRVRIDDDLLNNARAVDPAGAPRALERLSYYATLLLSVLGP